MADKLYWGVLFTESIGGTHLGMAQIDFLDASNNSLCVGGVALSKHTLSGYYPANLFNGNWDKSDAWYKVYGLFPCRIYYHSLRTQKLSQRLRTCKNVAVRINLKHKNY